MLFGDKSTFAIEIEYENELTDFGCVRLWLQNDYVGSMDESQIVGVALNQINLLLNSKENYSLPVSKDSDELFNYLETEQDEISMTSFGEAFDDFDIFCIKKDKLITFIFKLCDEPFFQYAGYDREIKCVSVTSDNIEQALSEIDSFKNNKE